MRITYIMLSKGFGGGERLFVDTALAMAARGHEVQAICHRRFVKKNLLENVSGVRLEAVSSFGVWDIFSVLRMEYLIRRFHPEVVNTDLKRAALLGGHAAHRIGIPVVARLHNYAELNKHYQYASSLICFTEHQRAHVLAQGWPENRVDLVPNFSRVPAVDRVRHSESGRPVKLLSYGRYVHKKGFDILLQAFARLCADGANVELTLYGDGPCFAELEKLRDELGVKERVKLNGWVNDIQVALDQSDLFVLPSRDEPFGIVMLEAMARGVPIVTTRTYGPVQVLDDSMAYIAADCFPEALYNALMRAVKNPDERIEKARRALELYRNTYIAEAVLPRILDVYRKISEA